MVGIRCLDLKAAKKKDKIQVYCKIEWECSDHVKQKRQDCTCHDVSSAII